MLLKRIFFTYESDSDDGVDIDIEGGGRRQPRRGRQAVGRMVQFLRVRLRHHYMLRPAFLLCLSVFLGACFLSLVFVSRGYFGRRRLEAVQSGAVHLYGYGSLQNLVMVAGHAVYTGRHCEEAEGENAWFLEPYQRHPGQASTFVAHIRAGVEAAAQDPRSLLLFSGGETRKDAGPRSEAQSYWNVAESKDWFGAAGEGVRSRALTEEHARDSFENLLFSICRFRELTGTYPQNITVVSYVFKKRRFVELHREALKLPVSHFFFIGLPGSAASAKAAVEGEEKVVSLFRNDPYGCAVPLSLKRVGRDPFARTIPYPAGCPEVAALFSYCGKSFEPGGLPWN